MPEHRTHKYVDRLLLGKTHRRVHRLIDSPYKLLGRKHRVLFHTPIQGFIVGTLAESSLEGGVSGFLHVIVDQEASENRNLKESLELLADLDSKKRRQVPRKRSKRRKVQRR